MVRRLQCGGCYVHETHLCSVQRRHRTEASIEGPPLSAYLMSRETDKNWGNRKATVRRVHRARSERVYHRDTAWRVQTGIHERPVGTPLKHALFGRLAQQGSEQVPSRNEGSLFEGSCRTVVAEVRMQEESRAPKLRRVSCLPPPTRSHILGDLRRT